MNFSQLFRRKTCWATAIYLQDQLIIPLLIPPNYLLDSKKLIRGPKHKHTKADPFLFLEDGRLFILYETQAADDFGVIEAAEITQTGILYLGVILQECFHLSYPSLIRYRDEIYMIPECQGSNELRLYRFTKFPREPIYVRTLLRGRFADPSPVIVDNTLFIFTTTQRGLEIFYTDDLSCGALYSHPSNPISTDPRLSRCGGIPFTVEGKLIRPAQDGSRYYGSNVVLMRIDLITKHDYVETLYKDNVFLCDQNWNSEGGHHISVAKLPNGFAIAVDGQTYDYLVHKLFMRVWLTIAGKRRIRS